MQEQHYDTIYQNEATHWWYRVRRIIVRQILSSYTREKRKQFRILDIGCGTGLLLEEMKKFGTVEGIDMSPRAIAYCKTRGLSNVSIGEATALPYPKNSFDVVVILDVLEHIQDDEAACKEIFRVLVPGGIVIIMVPAFMFLWGITDVVSQHFRRYTRSEIRKKVSDTGLIVKRATYFNTLLFPAIAVIRVGVRLLRIRMQSESHMGGTFGNSIFHHIFYLESILLRYVNFPFGVSILLIAEKK